MAEEQKFEALQERRIWGLRRNVFFMGLVSLFNDLSSELAQRTIPFVLRAMKVSMPKIAVIEGAAESTATLLKLLSGWISDKMKKRKALAVAGYGLSALTRPMLLLIPYLHWIFAFTVRFTDRLGKGIRTAPRDALIADSITPKERGVSFGFHRALDQTGAFLAYAIGAGVIYFAIGNDSNFTTSLFFWLAIVAIVPAAVAVTILATLVKEPAHAHVAKKPDDKTVAPDSKPLGGIFWFFMIVLMIFTLGNSSDAFLMLKASELGLPLWAVFLFWGCSGALTAVVSIPAGHLSDRIERKFVIVAGWLLYALVYIGFALRPSVYWLVAFFIIYGAYYGLTEGVAKALVADLVPKAKRGTAFGFFSAATGLLLFPASLVVGFLWKWDLAWQQGALRVISTTETLEAATRLHLPFLFGAVMAGLAAILMIFLPAHKRNED